MTGPRGPPKWNVKSRAVRAAGWISGDRTGAFLRSVEVCSEVEIRVPTPKPEVFVSLVRRPPTGWTGVESKALSRTTDYKDLNGVRASSDIEQVAVRAGDAGVVVQAFERPEPAVMVEYADNEGRTKALTVYSPGPTRLLRVIPETANRP